MLYSFSHTFTAANTEDNKQKFTLKMASGVINGIDIYFPHGSCGLVHIHVNRGLYQIVPVNTAHQLVGSGNLIRFNEDIQLYHEPYELELYGWNEDDTYDHTIDIKIELHSPQSLLRYIMSNLASIITFKEG